MEKKKSANIYEIDNRIVDYFKVLNTSDANILGVDTALIMEDPPLFKSHLCDMPNQSSRHRLFFVKKGNAHMSVNFTDYILQEGDLILIPSNFIVQFNHRSPDFDMKVFLFKFNTGEEHRLMVADTVKVGTGTLDHSVVDLYFSLAQQLLSHPIADKRDVAFLVVSLLHRLQCLFYRFPVALVK